MLQKLRNLSPVLLAIFIGGCLSGTHLVRPEADSLKNGQTKYSPIIERFGIPWGRRTIVKNEKTIEQIFYFYAPAGFAAGRTLGFYFFNDVLVGHEYASSSREDSTKFDDSKISQIIKGKSTRAEVTALVGRPGGFYIYPMIKPQSGEAAVYKYLETLPSLLQPSASWKSLVVTFDASGLVTDVEYSPSAN